MVPVMLTVVGAALRPASVTVTAGVTRLVTAFLVARVWVNRAAMASATRATAATKINMTRRGVSHGARGAAPTTGDTVAGDPEAGGPALTGVSARSSHEMLI